MSDQNNKKDDSKCEGCVYHNQLINLCDHCSRHYLDMYTDNFPEVEIDIEEIKEMNNIKI